MLELRTSYGTFSKFKDLYLFMIEQDIKKIKVDTYYIFNKVNSLELTLEEVKSLTEKQ